MIRCRRAAEWITRGLDDPPGPARRAVLGLHLLLCGDCRRFREQVGAVDEAAAELLARPGFGPAVGLPAGARERLAAAVRDELGREG
jgi:hypothetical protein